MDCCWGVVPNAGFSVAFQRCEVRHQYPSQSRVQSLPQALDGVEFGALGRQEDTHDMVRDHECFGLMTAPIIHQHNLQGSLLAVCKLIQTDMKVDRVQRRQFQQEALPSRRFDCPI
jgi:hypothetical protein